MRLHLIRHASAAERGPAYPDDTQRPLVAKGEAQARALAQAWERMGERVDHLATSPWLRARQTAAALRDSAGATHVVEDLARGDPARSARVLARLAVGLPPDASPSGGPDEGWVAARRQALASARVAAVGHEPWLSELAAWLLTGDADGLRVTFRKAAVLTLTGEPRPGGMALEAFIPMRASKALRGGP